MSFAGAVTALLLIASFWLVHNQCDLAINMIKVILVKSLILKGIDLLPCSGASSGLIPSTAGVMVFQAGIGRDGISRSRFCRYLCACDGEGEMLPLGLGNATDPPLPPSPFSSLSFQAPANLKTDNFLGK